MDVYVWTFLACLALLPSLTILNGSEIVWKWDEVYRTNEDSNWLQGQTDFPIFKKHGKCATTLINSKDAYFAKELQSCLGVELICLKALYTLAKERFKGEAINGMKITKAEYFYYLINIPIFDGTYLTKAPRMTASQSNNPYKFNCCKCNLKAKINLIINGQRASGNCPYVRDPQTNECVPICRCFRKFHDSIVQPRTINPINRTGAQKKENADYCNMCKELDNESANIVNQTGSVCS